MLRIVSLPKKAFITNSGLIDFGRSIGGEIGPFCTSPDIAHSMTMVIDDVYQYKNLKPVRLNNPFSCIIDGSEGTALVCREELIDDICFWIMTI